MLSGNTIIKNAEKQLKILAAKKINVHHLTGFLLASGFHWLMAVSYNLNNCNRVARR
jgi:hypothetical protein